jgi:XTP/dITP diphosphohydrolase
MELLLATNNGHKHREFLRLFPGFRILLQAEAGIVFDFAEGEESFLSNALGKARTLFLMSGRPAIGDDSGLMVDALGGAPGVFSARYGSDGRGKTLSAAERNAFLLERLQGVKERGAAFVCCLALVLEEDRFLVAQETVRGIIAEEPRGANGFGYDPLFFLPAAGKTIAEIPDAEKDDISHRGRAARRIRALLADESKEPLWT